MARCLWCSGLLAVALAVSVAAAEMPPRQPLTGRTLVFSRAQFKYPLYGNYSRRWIDRPLLHDRNLLAADEPYLHINFASFSRMVQTAKLYDLDGFAFISGNSGMHFASAGKPTSIYEFGDRGCGERFHLLPEFTGEDDPAAIGRIIAEARASRSVLRIHGKVVLTSYRADSRTPQQWAPILQQLRATHGDTFIALPDLFRIGGKGPQEWAALLDSGRPIPLADREAAKAWLRTYLDVFDGLYFAPVAHLRTHTRKFHAALYRDVYIPLFREVLDEPAYKTKYFALSAAIGYFMPETGSTTSEDGTRTLRRSFEAAMAAQPDLINLPEWDEQNENTFIRPTVYNSFSTQRILRHYMQRIRNQPLSPNPGDDTAVPNLIISYRKMLCLGERLEIELLNVPDSEKPAPYDVTLTLKDIGGKRVMEFPPQTLSSDQLADQTLVVPTEDLASHEVLIPSFSIATSDGRRLSYEMGFHHIHLRATWNWDLKWVKQPLRDMCLPYASGTTSGKGEIIQSAIAHLRPPSQHVAASFECKDRIAHFELLENDEVVFAADPQDEWRRNKGDHVLFCIERRSLRRLRLIGTLKLDGAACEWLGDELHNGREARPGQEGLKLNSNVDWYVRCLYAAVPVAEADKATLVLDSNLLKVSVPLKDVLANDIGSTTVADGLSFTVSRYSKYPHIPRPLNSSRASLQCTVRPELPDSIFHARAITTAGKFFFGPPSFLVRPAPGQPVPIHVYSDTAGQPVQLNVDSVRVPDLVYEFSPRRGAILHTPAGRPFWGILGGFADSATHRGGAESQGGTPFRTNTRSYPPTARKTAPDWVDHDGATCLKFDGIGTYVVLPLESLPRRAGFTLCFDIKPTSDKPQVLFNCQSLYTGSLMVRLNRGKLTAYYLDQHMKRFILNPDLPVPVNQWSRIEIVHDGAVMRFSVNGRASAPVACTGPGLYLGLCTFGGYGADPKGPNSGWFDGYLRSLRIQHRCNVVPSPH